MVGYRFTVSALLLFFSIFVFLDSVYCRHRGVIRREKPGVCPKSLPGLKPRSALCYNDYDCPGKTKCCGKKGKCVRPIVEMLLHSLWRHVQRPICRKVSKALCRWCWVESNCWQNQKRCSKGWGRQCMVYFWGFPGHHIATSLYWALCSLLSSAAEKQAFFFFFVK